MTHYEAAKLLSDNIIWLIDNRVEKDEDMLQTIWSLDDVFGHLLSQLSFQEQNNLTKEINGE